MANLLTEKRIFYINSRDRLAGTDANFSYSLAIQNNEIFDHAVVLQMEIPKSYYLVQTDYNTFTEFNKYNN